MASDEQSDYMKSHERDLASLKESLRYLEKGEHRFWHEGRHGTERLKSVLQDSIRTYDEMINRSGVTVASPVRPADST